MAPFRMAGSAGASASGDTDGPASATDTAIARFNGTTGKLLKNSSKATIADTGAVTLTADDAVNVLTVTSVGNARALNVSGTSPTLALVLIENTGDGAALIARGTAGGYAAIFTADATSPNKGAILLSPQDTDPVVADNGAIYYNSTTHKFRGCANGSWTNLH